MARGGVGGGVAGGVLPLGGESITERKLFWRFPNKQAMTSFAMETVASDESATVGGGAKGSCYIVA